LGDKYEHYAPWNPSHSIVSVDTNEDTWNETLHRLQFNILPPLLTQIVTLAKFLTPSELQDDTDGSKLKLIVETQSGLDQSLDQILSIAAGIKPKLPSSPARTDDNDLRGLKEFRRQGVLLPLRSLNDELGEICEFGASTMRDLKKGTQETSLWYRIRQLNRRGLLFELIISATSSIDRLNKWISRHEFINIQNHWGLELSAYDDKIADLTKQIHRTNRHSESEDGSAVFEDPLATLNKHTVPLAQALIPVIKLCRLFFKTLAKDGLKKTPLKLFTDMSSHQLETLSESPRYIGCDLSEIITLIEDADENGEYETIESISETIDKIIHRFDSTLLLVVIYIIPLIPNSISSPNHLQDYLVAWNNLFLMATQNFVHVAESYKASSESSDTHDDDE
jgi:hypothetical protein